MTIEQMDDPGFNADQVPAVKNGLPISTMESMATTCIIFMAAVLTA